MVLETNDSRTIAGLRTIEVVYVGDLVIVDGTHRIVPGQNVTPAAQNNNALSSSSDSPSVPSTGEAPGQLGRPSP